MPTKLGEYLILVMSIAFLASCGNALINNDQPNSSVASTQVLESTQAFENESDSNPLLAQTLISNTNYLDPCKSVNPIKLTEQIPYLNIWPGKTKESEVESILGTPDKRSIFRGVKDLVYDDTGLSVDIESGVVTYIVVNPEESNLPITLKEVILRYGCPDLILAVNTTEDQVGYNSVRFIYSTIGMEVSFAGYPTGLGISADDISYFPPATVQEYFEKNSWAGVSWSAQPVELNDAVK